MDVLSVKVELGAPKLAIKVAINKNLANNIKANALNAAIKAYEADNNMQKSFASVGCLDLVNGTYVAQSADDHVWTVCPVSDIEDDNVFYCYLAFVNTLNDYVADDTITEDR